MTDEMKSQEQEELEPGVEKFVTKADESKDARSITLTYEFGANLDDAVAKFGAEVVYGAFVKAAKINLQAYIRRLMNSENPPDDAGIIAEVEKWKPGTRQPRVGGDIVAKITAQLAKLPPEQRKEKAQALLEKLMAGLS